MDAPSSKASRCKPLEPRGEGFVLSTSVGPMSARSVVMCTGAYQRALSPPGTDGLPDDVTMLDTRCLSDTRRWCPMATCSSWAAGSPDARSPRSSCDAGRSVDPLVRQGTVGHRDGSATTTCSGGGSRRDSCRGRRRDAALPGGQARRQRHRQRVEGRPRPARRERSQAKGVTAGRALRGRARTDGMRFVDDLAESIAWADARYRDFSRWLELLRRARHRGSGRCPTPAPFDASRRVDRPRRASIGAVIFSGGFRPDYSWVHVAGGFDRDGLPGVRSTEPAPPSPGCSSWACISCVTASRRCSVASARTPRSWPAPSPGIWPRARPAHRDRTVQDPRPSTSASPPK